MEVSFFPNSRLGVGSRRVQFIEHRINGPSLRLYPWHFSPALPPPAGNLFAPRAPAINRLRAGICNNCVSLRRDGSFCNSTLEQYLHFFCTHTLPYCISKRQWGAAFYLFSSINADQFTNRFALLNRNNGIASNSYGK